MVLIRTWLFLTLDIITYGQRNRGSTRSSATYFLPYLGGRLVYGIYMSPCIDRDGQSRSSLSTGYKRLCRQNRTSLRKVQLICLCRSTFFFFFLLLFLICYASDWMAVQRTHRSHQIRWDAGTSNIRHTFLALRRHWPASPANPASQPSSRTGIWHLGRAG